MFFQCPASAIEDTTNLTYSITVTCTINPDSTADTCEVIATANGQTTLTGNEYEHIIFNKLNYLMYSSALYQLLGNTVYCHEFSIS